MLRLVWGSMKSTDPKRDSHAGRDDVCGSSDVAEQGVFAEGTEVHLPNEILGLEAGLPERDLLAEVQVGAQVLVGSAPREFAAG